VILSLVQGKKSCYSKENSAHHGQVPRTQVATAALNRLFFISVKRTENLRLGIYIFAELLLVSTLIFHKSQAQKFPPSYDKVMQRLLY